MWTRIAIAAALCAAGSLTAQAVRPELTLVPVPDEVEVYDPVEVTVLLKNALVDNPFRDVQVVGVFTHERGDVKRVEGFCDAAGGGLFRVRFMPTRSGRYGFRVEVLVGKDALSADGAFTARRGNQRGLLRVDRDHPWHFVWEGTGEHFFWNGTTTYWLLGWSDEAVIRQAIDRLARLKVNRVRVALCGRTTDGTRWDEPLVVNTDTFRFRLNPWPAARPDAVADPGFDVTRYDPAFWQKCERAVRHARDKGVVVSILFFLDGQDPGVDPFGKARAGGPEERAYYRYAVARLAGFSNVTWDVTNEYHLFRTEPWVNATGAFLKEIDPYQHLTSVHGHADYKFRRSPWSDFAMYQSWDEGGGHAFMLRQRKAQAATGRPVPQVNEEYGYEDHYPTKWGGGKKAPARSADNRRRLAWGMYTAGGYQTTGERADRGTGKGPDSGGGWINGRGDDAMTMLEGYGHIVTCFTGLEWWRTEPRDDLASNGAYCLAEPGYQYLVYLPAGGRTTVALEAGRYRAEWFNPRTGTATPIGMAEGPRWETPEPADGGDWALVLRRR